MPPVKAVVASRPLPGQRDDVAEELGQVRLGLVLGAAVADDVAVGRQDVPPRRAGRAGVRA